MRLLFKYLLSLFLVITLQISFACTGLELQAKDGSIINGRTLEFGVLIKTNILIIPRNFSFFGTLPDGSKGLNYISKYAVVGANMNGNLGVNDGLNEMGLAAGAFYFPGYAQYAEVSDSNKTKAVAPLEFVNWILTQFATVDEVKNALSTIYIVPTVFKSWGFVPEFHYIVYDKTGKAITIEPINGKLVAYDNPLGVLTNSPTFDWHLTNLNNYVNLSAINANPLSLRGMTFKPFGEGSGLHGLPGDFTPPSRFVRATIFTLTAIPEDNADKTVLQLFHILNQFDIPVGSVRAIENSITHTDFTMITCVRDPKNLKYYFKTYNDQNIKMVRLQNFDLNSKEIKEIDTVTDQQIVDLSTHAKNTNLRGQEQH